VIDLPPHRSRPAILREGFRDSEGTYLTDPVWPRCIGGGSPSRSERGCLEERDGIAWRVRRVDQAAAVAISLES